MGALSSMMRATAAAINELGEDEFENDGYKFKVDESTWSPDDFTVRAGTEEFVVAFLWKKLPGYQPVCPNLGHALRNAGMEVIDKTEYERLKDIEKKYEDLKETLLKR